MWDSAFYFGNSTSSGDTFFFESIEAVVEDQTIEAQLQENTITAEVSTIDIEAIVMNDDINLDLESLEIEAGKSCE